jgi:hypothetical protein
MIHSYQVSPNPEVDKRFTFFLGLINHNTLTAVQFALLLSRCIITALIWLSVSMIIPLFNDLAEHI